MKVYTIPFRHLTLLYAVVIANGLRSGTSDNLLFLESIDQAKISVSHADPHSISNANTCKRFVLTCVNI